MVADAVAAPVLSVRGLRRRYRRRGRLGRHPEVVWALDGASLEAPAGSLVAVVGPSGSGKSTLARCISGLEPTDDGQVLFEGHDVASLRGAALAAHRRRAQLVFQDPARALSPRMSVGDILREPLRIAASLSDQAQIETVAALLEVVGLPKDALARRAAELSGGQRQRLAIARALALEPALMILDESLAGLDVSLQAQILNLLLDLREARGLTLVIVSHDLGLVARVADRIAVLEEGRTVEEGDCDTVLAQPQHRLTRGLVAEWRRLEAGLPRVARA